MKYYFNGDNTKTELEINKVSDTTWSVGKKNFFVRKNCGKYFYSQDNISWNKLSIPKFEGQILTNLESFESFRGFIPSGLGGEEAGSLITKMPGKVIKIVVEPNQSVAKGDTLLILEAMKMENEIKATQDGVVQNIFVIAGQNIEAGTKMLEII